LLLTCNAHHTGHRLYDGVEGGTLAIGPGLAKSRDGCVDDFRIDRGHRFVVEAEALHHSGTVIFDEDVSLSSDSQERRSSGWDLEIERDAAFISVDAREIDTLAIEKRRDATSKVAAARHLDLDHLRPERPEQPGTIRTGKHMSKVEHQHAGKRAAAPLGLKGLCGDTRAYVLSIHL
jgi:hypothetical protein